MDKSNERVDPKANLEGTNKFTWNDHKCLEISARDVFPSQVTDTDIQKEIITKFLNFYLSGKIRKGLTVCDVTFATISIMPRSNTEEQFIWPSLEYKDHGSLFHISAEDKLKAEIDKLQCSNDKKSQVDGNTSEEIDKPGTSNKDQDTIIIDKPGTSNEDQDTIIIDKPGTSDEDQEIADIDYNEQNEVEKRTNSAKKYHSIEQRNVEDEAQKIDENEECSEAQFTHQMNGTETGAATPKESTPKLPSGIKWERIRSKRTTNILNYGPVQNAAFTAHCNNLLEKWDEDAAARIELKLIFGYIALTLMRATAKSPKHLANTFSSERFITSMQQLIGVSLPFCIPHKKCLKKNPQSS